MEEVDTASTENKKERDVYIKVVYMWDTKGTIYTNQTRQFHFRYRSENCYIMVMVAVESNSILVTPIKSRNNDELEQVYLLILKRIKQTGVEVRKNVLDSKCSASMKELTKNICELELVPPVCHQRNIAEMAIRTFKSHFVSILSGVDPYFLMSLWDKLLPQSELTLNLLRQSNVTPNVSVHAHQFGNFDYDRMPLAPL